MIKRRNMWGQVLLMILTLGFYYAYWFYVTSREVVEHKKLDGNPGLWTLFLLIPFGAFYSYWKHGFAVEALTDKRYSGLLIWVLWLVFAPAVWAITQIELNRLATK